MTEMHNLFQQAEVYFLYCLEIVTNKLVKRGKNNGERLFFRMRKSHLKWPNG